MIHTLFPNSKLARQSLSLLPSSFIRAVHIFQESNEKERVKQSMNFWGSHILSPFVYLVRSWWKLVIRVYCTMEEWTWCWNTAVHVSRLLGLYCTKIDSAIDKLSFTRPNVAPKIKQFFPLVMWLSAFLYLLHPALPSNHARGQRCIVSREKVL